jgi:hypothetical protein
MPDTLQLDLFGADLPFPSEVAQVKSSSAKVARPKPTASTQAPAALLTEDVEIPPMAVKAKNIVELFFRKHPLIISPAMKVCELHQAWGDWVLHVERVQRWMAHRERVFKATVERYKGQRSPEAQRARALAKESFEVAQYAAENFQLGMEGAYEAAIIEYTRTQRERLTRPAMEGGAGIGTDDFEDFSEGFVDAISQRPGIEETWMMTLGEVETLLSPSADGAEATEIEPLPAQNQEVTA